MDESLGTLSWKFIAQKQEYLAAVREMDAATENLRKKAEAPFRFAGGGEMAGAVAGGRAMASGPSIVGTSNGDVTWKLADATRFHQEREASSVATARSILRSIDKGDIDDPGYRVRTRSSAPQPKMDDVGRRIADEFIGQGRIRMAMGEARFQSDRSAAISQQQDIYDKLHGNARIRGELGEARFQARRQSALEKQQELANELMAANGASELSADAPSSPGMLGKIGGALKSRIPIRTLVRSTVVGIVVDAIAGINAAEVEYGRSSRMAGINQGDQARATLQLRRGILGAIPFVGGILNNIDSANTADVETSLALSDRQRTFSNDLTGYGLRTTALRSAAAISRMSPVGYGRREAQIRQESINRRAGYQGQFEEAQKNAGLEGAADSYSALNPNERAALGGRVGLLGPVVSRVAFALGGDDVQRALQAARDARNEAKNRVLRSAAGRQQLAGDQADTGALEEGMRSSAFQLRQNSAEISRTELQNAYRPVTGESRYVRETALNQARYQMRPGATAADREAAENTLQAGIQSELSIKRGIMENIRYGHGEEYNPYTQSPLAFTDRSAETPQQQFDEVVAAIKELTAELKKTNGGHP